MMKACKKGKYIITAKAPEGYILSNMQNRATVFLDGKEYKEYQSLPVIIEEETLLVKSLFKEGILIEASIDELELIEKQHSQAVNDNSFFNITIVPTFNCNFACSYCYQQNMPEGKITEKKCNDIITFIKRKVETIQAQNIHIGWYGGEPLLCWDSIVYINKTIIKYCNDKGIIFTSSIATNLYLIEDNMIPELINLGISRIETTITGTKEVNDKMRFIGGSKASTFDKIIENIKKVSPKIPTIININVSKENINNMDALIDYLKINLPFENIFVNFNKIIKYSRMKNQIKEIDDFEKIKIELLNKSLEKGINICDNTNYKKEFVYCPQQHKNSFAVDFQGNLYKCSEYFDSKTKVGAIKEGGDFFTKELDDSKYSEKCKNCPIVPYCNGGCYMERQKGNNYCPSEREYMEKHLLLLYKKTQLENKNGR